MTDQPLGLRRANRRDAEREQLYALTGVLARLEGRLTEAVSSIRGLVVNGVLFTGTVKLDANGQYTNTFEVPYGAVAVGNNDTAAVTFANTSPGPAAPTSGVGVHNVAAGKNAVFPVAGRDLTLYGTPGALITLGVYDRPQTAATFAPNAAGSLAVNDADGQANFVGASASDAHQYGFNGTTWDRIGAYGDSGDGQGTLPRGALATQARAFLFNGSSFDRSRSVAPQGDGLGVAQAMQPSATYGTATATAAAAGVTFAAVAGQSHRLQSVIVGYQQSSAAPGTVSISDGAAGLLNFLVSGAIPTPIPLPPGGIKAAAVNQQLSVSLSSGGVGIAGWVLISKLTA